MNDTTDLRSFAADLTHAGPEVIHDAVNVLHKGAGSIVTEARELAPTERLRAYQRTITYDLELDGTTVAVEIGPDRDINGQAKLAHLFEFGSSRTDPKPHLLPAFEHEVPAVEEHLADVAAKALR